MLHAHVLVLHLLGPFLGGDQRPVYVVGNIDFIGFPAGARYLGNAGDHGLQTGKKLLRIFAHFGQELGNQALRVAEQRAGQMLLRHFLILIFYRQAFCSASRLFSVNWLLFICLTPLGRRLCVRAPMVAVNSGRPVGQVLV